MTKKTTVLGILGCGAVGGGLAEIIERNREHILRRSGVDLAIKRILIRDRKKPRKVRPSLLTTDPADIVNDDDIDIVVELIGGLRPAGQIVADALDGGKSVVTANKALLSAEGIGLFRKAAARGKRIGFEAAVGGGIPIIRAIAEGLKMDRLTRVTGILNGTSNYLLTRIGDAGLTFADALREAKERGFCEADPSLDLSGRDAAQKLALLAGLAFGCLVREDQILTEGIEGIEREDVAFGETLGCRLKPVAVAEKERGGLDIRVHAAFIPAGHPLAHTDHENNAVVIRGESVGDLLFAGKGAGPFPTANAVLSDIVDIAANGSHSLRLPALDRDWKRIDATSEYYLRFPIRDVPGVIGLIATALGNKGISIRRVDAALAQGKPGLGNVRIVTHHCRESVMRLAVAEIARLPFLTAKPIRVRLFDPGKGISGTTG